MKRKNAIWLVAGGTMQEIAARTIKEMGFALILTDKNPVCACSPYADELVGLDTFDIQGNLKIAQELKKKYNVKSVLTVAADCHETVAHIGKKFNLSSIDPEIARLCRYKHETRDILAKKGIPQPQFLLVKTINQAKNFMEKMKGPIVLKATDNSGSRGFSKISTLDHLTVAAFNRALESGTTGSVIAEELLLPLEDEIAEQSVETVWFNGKMYWLNWVDRLFRGNFKLFGSIKRNAYKNIPWGIELGHINPAIHPYSTQKEIVALMYRAGLAIGMHKQNGGHILKADLMLTAKGPYILELTPRLSGGWDSSASTPARGGDFIGGAIRLALGEPLNLDMWHKHFQYKNPNLFSCVLAEIPTGAKDCIGRNFSLGTGFERNEAVRESYQCLLERKYVVPMVQ